MIVTMRSANSFVAKLLGVILIALALLFLPSVLDADTVYQQVDNFTAVGSGRTINSIASGIDYHRIAFYPMGAPAACTVKLEKSSDGVAWSDLIAAVACTSSGITTATSGLHAYLRITVTALTATTSVRVAYLGYRGNPGGGSLSSVDQGAAGVDPWLVAFASAQHIICDSGCGSAASVLMADNTANPTIPQSAAFGMWWDGANWDRAAGDSANGAWVNLKSSIVLHAIVDSGSIGITSNSTDFATQTTLALIKAKTDNIDVALSTRTKPADQQHVIVDSITAGATRIGKVTIRNAADLADIDPLAESTFTGRINTQGQKAMAASTPVVIASDQAAFPVTASAGTNLNTSALALEATQADNRTALQIMDDWDETDRAKVNPIVGQAGVQGASGVVTALTQRTVLATDVALPAGTNLMGKVGIDQTTPGTTNGVRPDTSGATAAAVPARGDYMGGSDGTNLVGLETVSAANNTATTTNDTLRTSSPCTWSITHRPAAATKATISKASGGGSVRHVAVTASWCLSLGGTLNAPINIDLIDGASGGATRLASWAASGAVNTTTCMSIPYMNSIGTAATAMTIEFSAAGAAASLETVNLCGYSVP